MENINVDNPHRHQTDTFIIYPLNTNGYVLAPPIPKAVRQTFSFLYLLSGEVLTEAGSESILMNENTFLIVPPNVSFAIRWYDNAIGFMGGFAESFVNDPSFAMLRAKHAVFCKIREDDVDIISASMRKLLGLRQQIHLAQITLGFLFNILSEDYASTDADHNKIVSQFLDDVFDRSKSIFTIQEYATHYSITPNHLNKVVKTKTGKPASEWIQISRINYAKYLLRNNSLTVVDVAEKVGLFDQSYFARFFKKYVGLTPSEYKRIKI